MGPACWQPTIFSGFVCSWVSVSVGRSSGARACMFLFPTTTSTLNCFKPRGLFINTGFVYKHGVSVNRAFSVLSLLDLLVFFYVSYMRFHVYMS